jgi:hypothetical protein
MSLSLLSICVAGALTSAPMDSDNAASSSLRSCTQRWETQIVLAQQTPPRHEVIGAATAPQEPAAPAHPHKSAKRHGVSASGSALPPD